MSEFEEILRCLARLETKVDSLESKVVNLEALSSQATAPVGNHHLVEKSRANKIDQCIDLLYKNATATLTDEDIDKLMCKLNRGVSNQNVSNLQPNSAWPSTSKESNVFQIPFVSEVQSGSSVDNSSANVNRKRKANSNESTVVTFNHSGANGMTDEDKSANEPPKNETASGKSTAKPLVKPPLKTSSFSNLNSMPKLRSNFENDHINEIPFRRSARNISKPMPTYRATSKVTKSKKVKTIELIEELPRKKLENLPNQKQTLEEFEKSHQSTGGDDKPQSKTACTQTSPAILMSSSNVLRENSHFSQNNRYMNQSGSNLTGQSVRNREVLSSQRDRNGQSTNSFIIHHGMMEAPQNEDRSVAKIDTPEKLSFSCRRNLWEQKTQDSIKNKN